MEGSLFLECMIRMTGSRKREAEETLCMALVTAFEKCSVQSFKIWGRWLEFNSMNNCVLEKLLPCKRFTCLDDYIIVEQMRWLSPDPVVSEDLLWPVRTTHLGHGHSHLDPLSSKIQMQGDSLFSSHSLVLAFLPLKWEQRVAPWAHLQIWVLNTVRNDPIVLIICPVLSARWCSTARSCLCSFLQRGQSAHELWKHGREYLWLQRAF